MARDWPWLSRAPIVEGLLDIQFEALPPERLPDLLRLKERLPDYPTQANKVAFAGQLALSPTGGNLSQQSSLIGYQFTTGDERRVFQARLNGVTLSFLSPYPRFSDLLTEAKRLWQIVTTDIEPGTVTRVALRYINKLDLPLPFSDFREYLLTVPDLAPGIPQSLASYDMRLIIPDTDTPAQAIVAESLQPAPNGAAAATIFLDIDVFQLPTSDQPLEGDHLWSTVEALRDYKNRLFFGTITDKLKELYQ